MIEQYFLNVEDAWRRLSLLPPAIRFELGLPQWRHRSLESHAMQVDPKPITRLLMGKALYGNREHVWLRELLQNALDATESRRLSLDSSDYIPQIRLSWVSPHLIVISDNGNGMTHQHVLSYLATLGRSGWRTTEVQGKDLEETSFFGRFGIGFASVFSVASRVTVRTRRATSRTLDGLRVSFSDPERPFFIEPATCPEGTEISVELKDPLSLSGLQAVLAELFAYVPASVSVEPAIDLPLTLESTSLQKAYMSSANVELIATKTSDVRIGAFPARLKAELFVLKSDNKQKGQGHTYTNDFRGPASISPSTALDISIDGIRVFKQANIELQQTGKRRDDPVYGANFHRGLKGFYVTVDFNREESPVLPSRDALDIDSDFINTFQQIIEMQFIALLGELIGTAASDKSAARRRARILRAYSSAVSDNSYVYRSPGSVRPYHSKDAIAAAAGVAYLKNCPVVLKRLGQPTELLQLDRIDPTECYIAITHSLAESPAFRIYADSREVLSWIVVDSKMEAALIEEAWPFDEELQTITSLAGLMTDIDDVVDEVRTGEFIKLLRGDYALVHSKIFTNELYMFVPSLGSKTPRHVGSSRTRNEASSMRPRVIINADHPLVDQIERYLAAADLVERRHFKSWLGSLCDGVIEDTTKLSPMARWEQLYLELKGVLGEGIPSVTFDSLRVRPRD